MKTSLIILLILGLTIQSCTKGCLKCTTENKCTLCDTTSFYKTNADACIVVEQLNCDMINLEGDCLSCKNGYWLNSTTKKCVVVETEKKVTNCLAYTSTQTCSNCEAHFVIEAAKCKAVTTQLTNCEVYSTETTCSKCKSGYFVSSDSKSCESVPTVSNCNHLSRFQCQSCDASFILNRNLYFKTSFKLNSSSEKLMTLLNILGHKNNVKSLENSVAVCQATTATNCAEFETFNTCKTCSSSYFLKEDKTCEAYPISIIANCSIYSSNLSCSACSQGFYRVSGSECKPVTSVENCSEYSQTTNTTQCTKCNAEFYLASATSCGARTVSAQSLIANCNTKSQTADKCAVCNTSFVLSSGGDECVTALASCGLHNPFAKGTTPTCNTCIDGFYLSNQVCTSGNDANCVTYLNTGTCDNCKNKWYHDGANACTEHITISNCGTYHNTTKNTCKSCVNNTFNFEIEQRCRLLTEIPNCIAYNHSDGDSVASCSDCADGYFKNGTTSCDLITVANCKDGTSVTACTSCKDGYVIFDNAGTNECRLPHDYMTDQCETVDNTGNANGLNSVTCTNCKINALSVDYTNNYVCVKNENLKDVDTINITTLIDGCIKYDTASLCALCESGKYLANGRATCIDNCPANTGMDVMKMSATPHKVLYNYECLNGVSTVAITAPNKNDFTANIDIKCVDSVPTRVTGVLGTAVKTSNVSLDGSFGNWVQDIGASNPKVVCPATDSFTYNDGATTTAIANCQYYQQDASTVNNFCTKCEHGKYGVPHSGGKYIVDCNSTMSSCNTGVVYGNLLGSFAQYFSCHKCSTDVQIPFLIYKWTASDNITFNDFDEFDLSADTNFTTGTNNGHTIECIDNSSLSAFNQAIKSTASGNNWVEHCGLGLMDLSDPVKANTTPVLCAACKPGYKPTNISAAANLVGTVDACTKIDSCTNSTWFNACSTCDAGNVHLVAANGQLDYTECVAHSQTDAHCFGAKAANSNCFLCKKGYELNSDGVCVAVNTPKCQEGKYVTSTSVATADVAANGGYFLWYNQQGAGCNQCNAGYTSIKYNAGWFSANSCASSAWVSANGTNFPLQQTSNGAHTYIDNCESYVVGAGISCAKCNANFVLRENGSECITLLNCQTAQNSGSLCRTCKTGFGLVNNLCAAGNIPNCATYNVASNQTKVVCEACSVGFFKTNNNTCDSGAVANCQTHGSTAADCVACKTGYFRIAKNKLSASGSAHDYCYKMDDSLNCSAATIASSDIGAKLTCDTCSVLYSVKEAPLSTDNQTNCIAFNVIENCETYNTSSSLATSTLLCSACKSGYYLSQDGFKCVKRTVNPIGCKTYQPSQDLCSACNDGNFLSTNGKECTKFPSGVIGCSTYSNATTCTACGANTWLNEGACTPVVDEAKVTNCQLYSNSITCSNCQANFFLEGNTCVALNVSNCLTVASKDACESCMPGFRLKTDNGKTTCESFSKPNCKTFEQSGTNNCTMCNQNFYINSDGECAAVTTIITNCLVNSTIDTCLLCSASFALSKDKKSCVNASVFDTNCSTITMPENMSCAKCNPGYYFKNNVCTAFAGKPITGGCFSQDLEDDKVCLVCNTGYYMNSSLNCNKNVVDPVDPNPVVPDNINIIRSLIAMIVSLIFLL